MSLINTEIDEFSLDSFKNGEFVKISKDDVLGKWAIFVFYPADFTFVCPTELGDIADHYDEIQALDAEVYGISTDSHFCHKAWWDSSDTIGKVSYALMSDNLFTLSKSFGVLRPEEGRANRATFIIDPDGVIQAYELTAEGIGRDADDLIRKLKAARYVRAHPDEVCPAKWKEGDETLAPSLDLVGKI